MARSYVNATATSADRAGNIMARSYVNAISVKIISRPRSIDDLALEYTGAGGRRSKIDNRLRYRCPRRANTDISRGKK